MVEAQLEKNNNVRAHCKWDVGLILPDHSRVWAPPVCPTSESHFC